ncbi:murein hydrolase activator EnvC family protein [Laceyella putida]|uniref:Murein hydrolase activator EnvC family protein n=1 Tax=Laceyella putida TaxID=110101 RepID=A0ABW2RG56_9BACL
MKKKLVAVALMASLIAMGMPQQQAGAEVTREQVQQQREKKGELLQSKSKYTEEMKQYEREINKLEAEIEELNKEFAPQQKKLKQAKDALAKQQEEYNKLIRHMYQRGENKYMAMLLSANSFNDFLHRFEVVRIMAKSDFAKVKAFREKVELAKKENKKYYELVSKIDAKQQELNAKHQKLVAEMKKIDGNLEAIQNWEEANEDEILQINLEDWRNGKLRFPYTGPLSKPTNTRKTSGFGGRYHPVLGTYKKHEGIDFAGPLGTPVKAAADGVVVASRPSSGYGWLITIYHGQYKGLPFFTQYAHSFPGQVKVELGQEVHRGEQITSVGNNGRSTGPHLHFEVRIGNGERPPAYNPDNYIKY